MAAALKITDTTFRDAHQSLLATRMRTEDLTPIAADMDAIGFHSMEVWGGATFDVATRFLAEDPWQRLRLFKELMPKTPLQMLLRGQSLVGYRSYADDVVNAFVERSAENGIDVFRVFDALNDEWNLESAADAVIKTGKHLQMTVCYSITGTRLGGPIYNLDYFLNKSKRFEEMGAHSIAVKDMAGLLAPYDAYDLIKALKSELKVPVHLHTHYTSGMASMTLIKAIEAGVDVVDTCLSPLALRTSQPAIEPLLVSLIGSDRDPKLDLNSVLRLSSQLETILPKYADLMQPTKAAVIDTTVLDHQIPGGMTSNLMAQLKEADALDRLDEVLDEVKRIRTELGYPPLVTPMSQMIGSQAVSNVLFGRYSMVSQSVADYALGLYGRPPVNIDEDAKSRIMAHRKVASKSPKGRPADDIEPELPRAKEAVIDLSDDIDDVLIYALYPTTGLTFLRKKYGEEDLPEEVEHEALTSPPSITTVEPAPITLHEIASRGTRAFDVYVDGDKFRVHVDPQGIISDPIPVQDSRDTEVEKNTGEILTAPMPGLILKYLVVEGQTVNEGQQILIIEAMKMENSLPAPVAGTVRSLTVPIGARVEKGAALAIITPN